MLKRALKKLKKKIRGFSLIELMIVIAIIGVLSSIVMVAISGTRHKARVSKVRVMLANLEDALALMALDTGQWPGHQTIDCTNTVGSNEIEDLNSEESGIVQNDTTTPYSNWSGPYMGHVPTDPWSNNYFFDTDYYVDDDGLPCDQDGGTSGCTVVAALGSLGQYDDGDVNDYDGDNVIRIVSRNICN